MTLLLDAYDRRARLTPGLLALAPLAIVIATLGWKQYPAVAAVTAVLVAAGAPYLLIVRVAAVGRKAQDRFWRSWDGRPTTHLLRLRTPADNPTQRDLWRNALEAETGVSLPSADAERADPTAADQHLEAVTDQVLYFGHQPDSHPVVAQELAQYGLERNLFGFRWVGRAICLGSVALLGAALWFPEQVSRPTTIGGLVVDSLFLAGWWLIPSERRTKQAGFRYARQLLLAVQRQQSDGST